MDLWAFMDKLYINPKKKASVSAIKTKKTTDPLFVYNFGFQRVL